jgi:hypothetical protein
LHSEKNKRRKNKARAWPAPPLHPQVCLPVLSLDPSCHLPRLQIALHPTVQAGLHTHTHTGTHAHTQTHTHTTHMHTHANAFGTSQQKRIVIRHLLPSWASICKGGHQSIVLEHLFMWPFANPVISTHCRSGTVYSLWPHTVYCLWLILDEGKQCDQKARSLPPVFGTKPITSTSA